MFPSGDSVRTYLLYVIKMHLDNVPLVKESFIVRFSHANKKPDSSTERTSHFQNKEQRDVF